MYIATGSAQGCAVGAAYRAGVSTASGSRLRNDLRLIRFSFLTPLQWAHAKSTEPTTSYEDFVYSSILRADLKQESDVAGARKVAEPDMAAYEAYGAWYPEWDRLEQEVEKRCLEAVNAEDA